jgi:hypothetical protein
MGRVRPYLGLNLSLNLNLNLGLNLNLAASGRAMSRSPLTGDYFWVSSLSVQ